MEINHIHFSQCFEKINTVCHDKSGMILFTFRKLLRKRRMFFIVTEKDVYFQFKLIEVYDIHGYDWICIPHHANNLISRKVF